MKQPYLLQIYGGDIIELSNALVREFAEVMEVPQTEKTEKFLYGTIKNNGESSYVKFDGSDFLTPITSAMGYEDGDRVMVMMKDHRAIVTSNMTSPGVSQKYVKENCASFDMVSAINARIDILDAGVVKTSELDAAIANIGYLKSDYADLKYASISSLNASNAEIENLKSTTIKTTELYAKVADLDYIKSDHADIVNLKSTMITTDTLKAEIAKIGYLTADEADIRYLTVSTADTKFLHADMSDMDIAKIQTLFATAGIVSDMTIKDGHITGVLDSVTVNANSITTGTLSVDRLVIRGSEKSLVYELNNISGALQTKSVDTLNGEIFTQRTITADKLVAKSITSNEIKAGTITSDEIAAGTIKAANINVTDLVGNAAFINSLKSNTVIVGLQNDINGISVGGRNLAQGTSSSFTNAYTNFTGVVNTCTRLAMVLTDGLSVGDTVTVRLIYKYTNVVAASGQTARCWIQGSGDVTDWNYGMFAGSPVKTLSGSGEHEFLYSFKITADHLKNSFWDTNIRHDYVQSGSVQWKMFKVEKGNKATDWTPAPEDVDSLISAAQSTADSANTLAGTANSAAGAAQTTANTALNNTNRGLGKWLCTQYGNCGKTIEEIVGSKATPVSTFEWADSLLGRNLDIADYYTGYAKTYCYFTADTSIATDFYSDDAGTVYLNAVQIGQNAQYGQTAVTFPFKKGWNVIEVVWNDGAVTEGFQFGTVISNHANCQRMDCYAAPPILDYYTICNGAGRWCYNNDITYINGGKIYTGTVTADKLAANSVTADKILAGAITADKLAANSVTSGKILAGAITADKLAANSVTADKILAGAITADKLAAGSITANELSVIGGLNVTDAKLYNDFFVLEKKSNGIDFIVKDADSAELFTIKTEHPATSSMWNEFMVNNFNQISFTGDDIYLNGSVYVNDVNLSNVYTGGGGLFNTSTALLINGNALNSKWAQLIIEYNGSCFGIRNDGVNTYLMNGNTNGWTNYCSFNTNGNWGFPGTLTAGGLFSTGGLCLAGRTNAQTTAKPNTYIDSAGNVWKSSTTSSKRFKEDVKLVENEDLNPENLYDIDVVQFKYKKDHFTNKEDSRYRKDMIGFIAEDVYEHYPMAADYHIGDDGNVVCDGWNEQYLIPAMLKLIQDQHKRILELEKGIQNG